MRKVVTIAATLAILLPAMALAASGPVDRGSALTMGQAEVSALDGARIVSVPLELSNLNTEIVAMDIPLSYGQRGDQVRLLDVTYTARVDYFDVKVTNIDNDNKTVVMGLIAMATDPNTPDMAKGEGPIAYLKFEVTDNTLEQFTIAATEMERPSHRLMLVSHDYSGGQPEVVWEERTDFSHTVNLASSGQLPQSYSLKQNYPNPFNAGTVIGFNLKDRGEWNLKVYNLLGQAVRSFDGNDVGQVSVTWDGTDEKGRQVASGVYFYRLQAADFNDTKKMTLLK